jgi:hypothetical protein
MDYRCMFVSVLCGCPGVVHRYGIGAACEVVSQRGLTFGSALVNSYRWEGEWAGVGWCVDWGERVGPWLVCGEVRKAEFWAFGIVLL